MQPTWIAQSYHILSTFLCNQRRAKFGGLLLSHPALWSQRRWLLLITYQSLTWKVPLQPRSKSTLKFKIRSSSAIVMIWPENSPTGVQAKCSRLDELSTWTPHSPAHAPVWLCVQRGHCNQHIQTPEHGLSANPCSLTRTFQNRSSDRHILWSIPGKEPGSAPFPGKVYVDCASLIFSLFS